MSPDASIPSTRARAMFPQPTKPIAKPLPASVLVAPVCCIPLALIWTVCGGGAVCRKEIRYYCDDCLGGNRRGIHRRHGDRDQRRAGATIALHIALSGARQFLARIIGTPTSPTPYLKWRPRRQRRSKSRSKYRR